MSNLAQTRYTIFFCLLIHSLTCFGLSCWPSSGSSFFFYMRILCLSLYGWNSTYM